MRNFRIHLYKKFWEKISKLSEFFWVFLKMSNSYKNYEKNFRQGNKKNFVSILCHELKWIHDLKFVLIRKNKTHFLSISIMDKNRFEALRFDWKNKNYIISILCHGLERITWLIFSAKLFFDWKKRNLVVSILHHGLKWIKKINNFDLTMTNEYILMLFWKLGSFFFKYFF